MVMILERFYIKTRGIHMTKVEAEHHGIRRVYNATSDIDYMDEAGMRSWSEGLYEKDREAVLIESALRFIEGVPIYISSCIVFNSLEMCNVYFMKNTKTYKHTDGFFHLLN
jgi:hypothetical protein